LEFPLEVLLSFESMLYVFLEPLFLLEEAIEIVRMGWIVFPIVLYKESYESLPRVEAL